MRLGEISKRGVAVSAAAIMVAGATSANAAAYRTLIAFDTIFPDAPTVAGLNGFAIDGDTAYVQFRQGIGSAGEFGVKTITGVDSGAEGTSVLFDRAKFEGDTGLSQTGLGPTFGFGLRNANTLQFVDSLSGNIFQASTVSGTTTSYVTFATISTLTGEDDVRLFSPNTILPSGEMVFYEADSDKILISDAGTAKIKVQDIALQDSVVGSDSVSGGLGVNDAGEIFFGSNTPDSLFKLGTDGTISTVLSKEEITAVTGDDTAGFGDIFVAPDGNVYFTDTAADGILSFNPADPAGTLAFVLTEDQLNDGPAERDFVGQLGWWEGNLAFVGGLNTTSGVYVVPEPASMVLFAAGSLLIARRRRA